MMYYIYGYDDMSITMKMKITILMLWMKKVIMLSMYDNDDNAEDEVVTHTVMLNVMRMLIMILMNQDNGFDVIMFRLLCYEDYDGGGKYDDDYADNKVFVYILVMLML